MRRFYAGHVERKRNDAAAQVIRRQYDCVTPIIATIGKGPVSSNLTVYANRDIYAIECENIEAQVERKGPIGKREQHRSRFTFCPSHRWLLDAPTAAEIIYGIALSIESNGVASS